MTGSFIRLALASLISLFIASDAVAANYQYVLGTSYSYLDFDNPLSSDGQALSASATYHLEPVQTRNHPLAEAAFIERSSQISASYSRLDLDGLFGGAGGNSGTLSSNIYIDRFFLGGELSRNESVSTGPTGVRTTRTTDYHVQAGYSPLRGTLFTLGYGERDENDLWSLSGRSVKPIGGEQAVAIASSAEFTDDSERYSVELGYYFTRYSSLNTGITHFAPENTSSQTRYTIGASYFVTPKVGLGASYGYQENLDTWQVDARVRF